MSDSYFVFVPGDPLVEPGESEIASAEQRARELLPAAESIRSESTREIRFIDAGENWEGVGCPYCHANLEDSWSDMMSSFEPDDPESLLVTLPCCSARTSLNDLDYRWPVAFGRFDLTVMNPDTLPDDSLVAEIGRALGTPVRLVRRHV